MQLQNRVATSRLSALLEFTSLNWTADSDMCGPIRGLALQCWCFSVTLRGNVSSWKGYYTCRVHMWIRLWYRLFDSLWMTSNSSQFLMHARAPSPTISTPLSYTPRWRQPVTFYTRASMPGLNDNIRRLKSKFTHARRSSRSQNASSETTHTRDTDSPSPLSMLSLSAFNPYSGQL